MITGEVKNKINNLWDTIWSAGLTNPLTAMEQITYLLFIKILDDNQIKKEKNAQLFNTIINNPTFPEGNYIIDELHKIPYKSLRWSNFKNYETVKMFEIVKDYVFPFIKNLNEGKESAFSRYMQDAIFLIPTPRVLDKLINGLEELELDNKDIMGDVYEYLLGQVASSGKNGQFRTPRNIIAMMVELMKPTLNDSICDPAMGSAGFIVESAKYINKHQEKELLNSDNSLKYRNVIFNGFDTDQTMLRIGAMNMMLHGVENPNIKYQDSLSEDNKYRNCFTLILANPPFTGSLDYDNVSKDILDVAKTSKTELLFLSLFVKMLKNGGRCASIVPDGVLFGSSNAHKSIREELVINQKLEAVISMPSGIFQPYAGVKTSIVIFTKTNCGGTDKVWFYDMQNDGYSLDVKRSEIEQNDIPDIINRFNNLENEINRNRTEQSFFVTLKEITNNNYDLTINKYKETIKKEIVYRSTKDIIKNIKDLENEFNENLHKLEELLKDENKE